MFDFVEKRKVFIKVFLGAIALTFVASGTYSYMQRSDAQHAVAQVDGAPISPQALEEAVRTRREQLQQMLGGKLDPELLNGTDLRKEALQQLIDKQLLLNRANELRLAVTDAQLADVIQQIPAFQEKGKFSQSRYESMLKTRGMNPLSFEARLREDLRLEQAVLGIEQGQIVADGLIDQLIALGEEQRMVRVSLLKPEHFLAQAKVDKPAIEKYFNENKTQFVQPERVKIEYVVLSQSQLQEKQKISAAEVEKYYQEHQSQYQQAEQRRARHILLKVAANAPAAEQDAVKKQAQALFEQVKAKPEQFAQLAKEKSQDPGSAVQGGDLGWFGKGMMVKPFEDAVFALAEGGVSAPIKTEFGWHIIQLTAKQGAKPQPLAAVQAEIERTLKEQAATRLFAEQAEPFSNLVYEQGQDLKAAAEKFNLKRQDSDWIASKSTPADPLLNHPKVMSAIFGAEAIKNKRNLETIEVAPNTLLGLRVVAHEATKMRTLAEVQPEIEQTLRQQQAASLAEKRGQGLVADLAAGKNAPDIAWSAQQGLSRGQPMLPTALMKQIFAFKGDKWPQFTGGKLPNGSYAVVAVDAVKVAVPDAQKRAAYRQNMQKLAANAQAQAWMNSLRQQYPVKVNQAAFSGKPATE